ncbi:hypothetical protein N9383_05305 [Granulosicoccus sp.]|nr:hypothetical protein [Granulosicoccus sp.]
MSLVIEILSVTSPSSSISARIRHAREQARLEPKALREALAQKGYDLSKTGLHRLETIEPMNPSVKLMEAIAQVTNVSPGWLLFGTGTALKADAAANAIRGRVLDTIELMSQALDMTGRQQTSFDKWLASMRSTVPSKIERP